jgi:hypothetical protein
MWQGRLPAIAPMFTFLPLCTVSSSFPIDALDSVHRSVSGGMHRAYSLAPALA